MSHPRKRLAYILLAILAVDLPAAGGSKPRRGPDVLVVADATPDSSEALRPAPDRPIYYIILGKEERHLGQPVSGEPMPEPVEIEAQVVKALESQGFRKTGVGGPMPSIAILVVWGEANLMVDDFEFQDPDAGEEGGIVTESVAWNRREIRQLVGANKPASLTFIEADQLNEAANDDRWHVTIAALDVQALARREKKLIWRTRISVYSHRRNLADVLPVMLASAAPMFGVGNDKAVFVDDALRRKAEVEIGDLQVVADDVPPVEPSASEAGDRGK